MRRFSWQPIRLLVPLTLSLVSTALFGCGGDGGGLTFPPTTGILHVTATASGDQMDTDGYTVQLDAEAPMNLAPGASLDLDELAPGAHAVFLGGVASNCSVADNPRTLDITAGQTSIAEFVITCTATSGGIVVTTTTTGDGPDPDGYSIILDGGDLGAIPASGQMTLTGLAIGSHVVGLTGIEGNCQVQGDNLRTVTVTAGGTATVDYAINCTAPPPGAGTLNVVVATTGADLDADGYSFSVDGGPARPIGANAMDPVSSLAPGVHTVQLSGVASNCRIQGTNPRSATVPAGGSVDVSFAISCTQRTGTVQVSVATNGRPVDPNGYVVKLDGSDPGKNVTVNGSVHFDDVPVGDHSVSLADLASNCTADAASKPVSLIDGHTSTVSFTVTCSESTGSIVVTTQTGGDSPDADGYTIRIDGTDHGTIPSAGQQEVTGIATGSHTVTLTGVASNCAIDGDDDRTVTVPDGGSVTVAFTITCTTPQPDAGTVHVTTVTTGDEPDQDGYQVAVGSSGAQNIGPNSDLSINNVPAGNVSVQLSGVAQNCWVEGDNPRQVSVSAGATTDVRFNVSCAPTLGFIDVSITTTGDDKDDGYTLTLNSGAPVSVANDAHAHIGPLAPQDYQIALGDVAPNCQVSGDAQRTVSVSAGQTSNVEFTVNCTALTGTITVNATTTGADPDPDGFTVSVTGSSDKQINPNGSAEFSDVSAGSHQVALSGVADNCSVTSENPTNATVSGGQPTEVDFAINCTPLTGSIRVTTQTVGADLDPDGYQVSVDDAAQGDIGVNSEQTLSGVTSGNHAVALSGVASNCQVSGDNPQTASVPAGNAVDVAFTINCAAISGAVGRP